MTKTTFAIIILAIINLISFSLYGIDKAKAENKTRRISERTLLTWAFFAPLGAGFGMKIFHHKTNKKKFKILIPLFLVLHVALGVLLLYLATK